MKKEIEISTKVFPLAIIGTWIVVSFWVSLAGHWTPRPSYLLWFWANCTFVLLVILSGVGMLGLIGYLLTKVWESLPPIRVKVPSWKKPEPPIPEAKEV